MIRQKERPGPREPLCPAFPRPLAKGKPRPGLCKEVASEEACPLLWGGTFAVKSVRGIFIPLIQPGRI